MRSELRTTACLVFAFVGAVLPLLLLLGLKQGAIGVLVDALIEDPRNREVIAVGAGSYDAEFFERARALDGMSFIVPSTRSISARFVVAKSEESGRSIKGLGVLSTASRDPLYDGVAPDWNQREIVLSARAASELDLSNGDSLTGFVERVVHGGLEAAQVSMKVVAIAPAERIGGRYVLAPLPLLEAMENFVDDETIEPDQWLEPRGRTTFASFRTYSDSVHTVQQLTEALSDLKANVRIRSDDAALLLRLDRLLGTLYIVVAACGGGGFFLALTANLRANLERQRVSVSILRLMGAANLVSIASSIFQAISIVTIGLIITILCYFALSSVVNLMFSDLGSEEGLIQIHFGMLGAFVAGSLLLSAVSSIWTIHAAAKVGPEEGFRGG